MSGFGTREYGYKLNINHDRGTYAIAFNVSWQGSEFRTHQRAIRVGVSIFAIAQYGSTSTAYPLIAEQLREESCEGIVAIHEALQGQQFTGKLRAKSGAFPGKLIAEMASQHGLVQGVDQFEAHDVARLLA
jgi:hypothetical protein